MKLFNIIFFFLLYTVTIFSQWESIGPYGGYIRCLIKDNSGRVLSGNAYGGIFRSSDAGKNWEQLFTGYRYEDVRSLAVNSNNHIFAGTDLKGLYRSTNDGVTWERLSNSVSTRTINDILIKSNGDIFVATFDGVYHSTDNGTTFILKSNGITTSLIFSLGLSANYIFAGTGNAGIFRSGDDGATWEEANSGITFQGRNVYDFSSSEFVYGKAMGKNGITDDKIYATFGDKIVGSSTEGTNWEEYPVPSGNYFHLLKRNNGNIVAVGSKILNSSDPGGGWTSYSSPTAALLLAIVAIDDNTLVVGTEGPGTFVSTNNNLVDWNLEVTKMSATAITDITTTSGAVNVSTRHSGIFRTNDDGLNWYPLGLSIPNGWYYGLYEHPTTGTLFALHQNGVYRSTDGAVSWNGPSVFGETMDFNSLGDAFIASGSYVYKTMDDGGTYQQKLVNNSVTYIRQIAVGSNNDILLATANNNGFGGQGVYASFNLGETYEPINTGLPNNITAVEAIILTGFTSEFCINNFAAASSDGKYFSMNDDYSWNEINVGFQQNQFVKDIASINYTSGIKTSIITENEMFSVYGQSNCNFMEEIDLPNDINFFKIRNHIPNGFNRLNNEYTSYLGTIGGGVLKKVVITNVENTENNLPLRFAMKQNYPNPFNPSTTIKYTIPNVTLSGVEGSRVQLKIYDVLGNEVATLVDEFKSAGMYTVEFNGHSDESAYGGQNLSSGIYFYRLKAGSFVETRKMILLK